MNDKPGSGFFTKRAQTMIELAVFGAVLFFLIGGIASNYLSGSFQSNGMLKAMRIALESSYKTAHGTLGSSVASTIEASGARNTASVLIYEDRLSGEFGKYGSIDRSPVVASGSGMMSNQLYYPMDIDDFGDRAKLSLMDVKINGQTFKFTTSSYVVFGVSLKNFDPIGVMPMSGVADLGEGVTLIAMNAALVAGGEPFNAAHSQLWACMNDPGLQANPNNLNNYFLCNPQGTEEARRRLSYEMRRYSVASHKPPFYRVVMSNATEFDIREECARNFDLDRDGDPANNLPQTGSGDDAWKDAYWQWKWESFDEVEDKIDEENQSYPSFDVNGDLVEETIVKMDDFPDTTNNITRFLILTISSFGADIDNNKRPEDFEDPKDKPGLHPEMHIYSRTYCVATATDDCTGTDTLTTFDVVEGKLLQNGVPANISTVRKNQYDIVERIFQLNVNMIDPGGFYDRNKTASGGGIEVACHTEDCCMRADNKNLVKTCFDSTTKTLYVRSRITDKRKREWTTRANQTWGQSLGAQ